MKLFQVVNDICYWDATRQFPTKESTVGYFPPDLVFVEAPDNVFEGWGYLDGEFIKPTPPDGWVYDEETGTFYPEDYVPEEPSGNQTVSEASLNNLLDALIS